ncbi:prepilin peptidase [Serpentinicella sp. ANB-PHB4]|uniref:prepilin peptidase n=1 Tax=Serpentinicella sp. ANB-PHB4 TaxID=3074076 RepID=UPI002857C3F6|nr:prepilin peptidase [Serpentinicella sp. ANB-PHB4]MDR5658125.1 prepilin peptidase [Serpentinicella sp. ANB-PHB4]
MEETIFITIVAILIGSFLNVVIYRIPKNESIVFPASHCFSCNADLKAWDLIPVLSYLSTKGKCRYCGEGISLQYPIIELMNGLLYFLLYLQFGLSIQFLFVALLTSLLLAVSVIDLYHQIIPDEMVLFGIGLWFAYKVSSYFTNAQIGVVDSIAGFLLGGGILLLIAIVSKGGMGGGDIKLMGMLGLWLGWKYTLLTMFLSFFIGAIITLGLLALKLKGRKDFIPFGPFIAIAAFLMIIYGDIIFDAYLKLVFSF